MIAFAYARLATIAVALTSSASGLLGCAVERSSNAAYRDCRADEDCDEDQHCHRGYCVDGALAFTDAAVTRATGGDGGGPASPGAAGPAGDRPTATAPNDAPRASGAAGPAASSGSGSGSSPDAASGLGSPPPPPTESCTAPSPEVCNGEDDDCDGMSDELSPAGCYPGTAGCVDPDADGTFDCAGGCRQGARACTASGAEECTGAVLPAGAESCTGAGELAADEDCDGHTDEGCACAAGGKQSCFEGPSRTIGVGPCVAGTQTCGEGTWEACRGAVLPQPESCANPGRDDDCNGQSDDIARLGDMCNAPGAMGRCRSGTQQCVNGALTCLGAAATAETCDRSDEDCDGKVDEGFSLQTDAANCGSCGNRCESGFSCCGGRCADTRSSATDCGACGTSCGSGESCCAGGCVDTSREPANCGGCGHVCTGLLQACCEGVCKTLCVL